MKKVLILLSLWMGGLQSYAQCSATSATNGASFGNDASIGTLGWFATGNAALPDNIYSTAGQLIGILSSVQTNYLTAQNFGFSIPTGAAICGIEVEVQRHGAGIIIGSSIKDNSIKIIKNGVITGGEQSAGASWPGIDAYATYGGSANQWGTAWTPANINAANFGVAISTKLNAGLAAIFLTAEIDHIRITVYYDFLLAEPPLYFRADVQPPGIKLNWATAPASQTKYFIVEKSTDNQNWSRLDSVTAVEGDATGAIYQSLDPAPGPLNYYRLQHAGRNDKLILDYTIATKYNSSKINGIAVYTDLISGRVTIACEDTIKRVQLFDMNMHPIQSTHCSINDTKTVINTTGIKPSMYIAKLVAQSGKIYTAKLMVIK